MARTVKLSNVYNAQPTEDAVTRPAHYGGEANPHEPIKVIEHYELGFCLGNAIKYLLRAPFKGSTLDDLKKARWYVDREIQRLEREQSKG